MDTNKHLDYRAEIDFWADKYEAAVKRGVFKDADKDVPNTSPQTSTNSFFGITNANTTEAPKPSDAEYWNQVSKLASGEMINEENRYKKVKKSEGNKEHDSLFVPNTQKSLSYPPEAGDKEELEDMERAVAKAANPIRHASVGSDQEIEPLQLGNPLNPEDIAELAELKIKLHDLQSQLNDLEGRVKLANQDTASDKGEKAFRPKIDKAKQEMDDLSNRISTGFQIDSQGD